ncbi:(d)CMP kinase [Candidatus Desantisbacteria bacterium]|nr:(d)CMP kinase [Candidatus Desantisbacteria bacterium]
MDNKKRLIITIDGPAGVGKSTVSKTIARRLGLKHIDSGAIYRAITYKVLTGVREQEAKIVQEAARPVGANICVCPSCDQGASLSPESQIQNLKSKISNPCILKENGITLSEDDIVVIARQLRIEYKTSGRIILDGDEVTNQIRSREVTRHVSAVAAYKGVRDVVVNILRGLAADGGVVMEGRDIGSVVLPDADFKFYLDATLCERAIRRYKELKTRDKDAELYKIQLEIKHRDKQDSSREIAPLVMDPGATYIDTSVLTLKEVISLVIRKIDFVMKMDGMLFFNSSNLLYYIVCFVLRLGYTKYFGFNVQGLTNIPATGGVLLVCNHLSYLDPPAVAVSLPRQASYIARSSLFTANPLFGWFLKKVNAYPINRDGVDRDVFKRVMALLDNGKICLAFPEGTRSKTGQLQPAKPGIGMIISMAKNNGVRFSVVPCKISGSDKAFPRGAKWFKKYPISLSYGEPIDLSDLLAKQDKQTYQAIADRIMEHIGRL